MDVFLLLVLAIPILAIVAAIVNSTLRSASKDRPRGFPWILAFFVLAAVGGVAILVTTAQGRQQLVIRVKGPAGASFVGRAEVDGRLHDIDGVAPAEFQFTGRTFGVVVLAAEPATGAPLEVSFEGDFSGMSLSDAYGVRFGAFKRVLAGGASCTPVSPEEWDVWMEKFSDASEATDPLLPGAAAPSNPESASDE
jgi:hypothetical protein